MCLLPLSLALYCSYGERFSGFTVFVFVCVCSAKGQICTGCVARGEDTKAFLLQHKKPVQLRPPKGITKKNHPGLPNISSTLATHVTSTREWPKISSGRLPRLDILLQVNHAFFISTPTTRKWAKRSRIHCLHYKRLLDVSRLLGCESVW